ncbi:LOW QUALITY PROTEIN: uncharacterized protein LOC106174422 [Lingula anatina]|uniref:LOW QUALITY PROTEIN: uncharacterized protein LOC106174422 n=1 Tax=Lingula anatina TaxID=7574 RepID=A0A1S3JMS8_LINAN|nr:LOW QUALITY PROTEIN: uncharacterized protein LOC106174422 [Lingula anatina]|eukprot:XP_013411441.1 LOW QUALITY PROTEIN: uncharacterized protein LOC106174422 [Lingula anatina]
MSGKAKSPLGGLRIQNQSLLQKLRQGQVDVKRILGDSSRTGSGCSMPITPNRSLHRNFRTPRKSRMSRSSERKALSNRINIKNVSTPYSPIVKRGTPGSQEKRNVSFARNVHVKDTSGHGWRSVKTPRRSAMTSLLDTPKSILKKRKLIDENIPVSSKFRHEPDWERKAKRKRSSLNFSYSEVDQSPHLGAEFTKSLFSPTSPRPRKIAVRTPQRYNLRETPSRVSTRLESHEKDLQTESPPIQMSPIRPLRHPIEAVRRELPRPVSTQLEVPGNERKGSDVYNTDKRPKSVLISAGPKEQSFGKLSVRKGRETKSRVLEDSVQQDHGRPLLGYDWIAGLLDNNQSVTEMPDAYFEQLKEFRRVNKAECVSRAFPSYSDDDFQRPEALTPELKYPDHTCIHTYTINERLYPVPVNEAEDGQSVCPICNNLRRKPTTESPGYVRVSFPRSTLQTPYKLRPHRRKSFDPSDSYALSQHCLAGWDSSRPSVQPPPSNLDLRGMTDGLKAQLTATLPETQKIISEEKRALEERLNRLRPLHMVTRGRQRQLTDDLLNVSHSLMFELQNLERERLGAKRNPAIASSYIQ